MFEASAEILAQRRRQLFGFSPPGLHGSADLLVLHHGGDMVMVRNGPVIGEFIEHPQADEDGYGHPDGKAADIDGGGELIAGQVAEGDAEIGIWGGCSQKNAGLVRG
jgi:hypothetical protein